MNLQSSGFYLRYDRLPCGRRLACRVYKCWKKWQAEDDSKAEWSQHPAFCWCAEAPDTKEIFDSDFNQPRFFFYFKKKCRENVEIQKEESPQRAKELLHPVVLILITVQFSALWLYLVINLFGKLQHLWCDEGHFPHYFHGQKMVCLFPSWLANRGSSLVFSIRALKSVTENSKSELFVFLFSTVWHVRPTETVLTGYFFYVFCKQCCPVRFESPAQNTVSNCYMPQLYPANWTLMFVRCCKGASLSPL